MASILIVGAGWLGRPLAKQLSTLGHQVSVTNSQQNSVLLSQQYGLQSSLIQLPLTHSTTFSALINSLNIDIVIGCITPGFRRQQTPDWDSYANNWQQICDGAARGGAKKIIMVSSTAVYPSIAKEMVEQDAHFNLAREDVHFSQKSIALLKAEQVVMDCGINFAIIRCSGLVDDKRHPSRFVSRLKSISTQAPANMLHKRDAIGFITLALDAVNHQVVNVSTPNTCDKATFYTAALKESKVTPASSVALPTIVHTPDKKIDSSLSQQLGYQYLYQHSLDLL
ncbi:NAD-dependent epimerase/dehydratase family protein [Vibrio rarus]|uniref:NAD-dependent epimerase/dehydratase family protein n=1 Tax=Vibrio rarus TaxID=413403 RepID=UPI0021C3BE7E|nr:NAD-dependent epimerase/dehydratase family protein [Vibrio rarus]